MWSSDRDELSVRSPELEFGTFVWNATKWKLGFEMWFLCFRGIIACTRSQILPIFWYFEVSLSIFTGSGPDVSSRPSRFRPAYLIQALKQGGTGLTIARAHGPLLCGEVRSALQWLKILYWVEVMRRRGERREDLVDRPQRAGQIRTYSRPSAFSISRSPLYHISY